MTKVVNINILAPETSLTIVIKDEKGEDNAYDMRPITVGSVMEVIELMEKTMNAKDFSVAKEIELMIKVVQLSFPKMPIEIIKQMDMNALRSITSAAQGVYEDEKEGDEDKPKSDAEKN